MDIGFIGLGHMGRAIVANLVKAGHTVRVWNRSPGPVQEAARAGATAVDSPAAAFAGDAVFSMLADDDAVREAILASGALAQARKGLVHVNMATVSVALADEMAHAHQAQGVAYLAAPVLGRPDVAAAGKLNILAGGDAKTLAHVQPLLDAIGQKTWHLGDVPSRANAVKLAVNFMLGAAVEATAEAAALAGAHGLEPDAFIKLITGTVFPGPVYEGYGRRIASASYTPAAFAARLAHKDLRLALAAAGTAKVPMPLASVVHDALLETVAVGDGESDLAVLGKTALRRAGKKT
ncbi:MAG TPA: NAD(P)-dependent oxidoreductase [Pinirhizobacter sp.]|uniref:NAD(P)-dependent oxidoreductase n=1 Tax=Pinirhizobacter sp. TaxID=2950432 RepID=UPI002B8E4F83|nr:NAD(P)-dependent oxidoreductase [Pinirhizobacter sp.]HMH67193.1 NAD(P)-dependent oxidoreductase [Pinirhizobacter sp.]